MLLRTLFVTLLLSALAESMVHGVHALAQMALRRQAVAVAHDEVASSAALARIAVARAIAAGADPRHPMPVGPSPAPQCRLHVNGICAILGSARIVFDSPVAGGGTPSPCPSNGCVVYEQENDAVSEGRVGATVTAQAIGPDGAVLASRRARVGFRTLRVPPYAAPVGEADASAGDVGGPLQTGDDGGSSRWPGTLIDVQYENAATGAAIPANVWRSQLQSGTPTSQPWSP